MKQTNNKGHLSAKERDKITILYGEGLSIRKIARILDRNPSTISRELKRKEAVYFRGKYIGSQTHINVSIKWKEKHKRGEINNHPFSRAIRRYIKENLKLGYSPQIIAGRLKQKYDISIHHETIYRYIYKTNMKNGLVKYLLRRKMGRISRKIREMNRFTYTGKGKNIPNRIDIDLRPTEANLRLEFGHFEADTIESKKRRIKDKNGRTKFKAGSCLTVLADRKTRAVRIIKTASKTAQATITSIVTVLKPFANNIHSITYDNGLEFSKHEKINESLNIKSYFCKPYHSWEKGTVENINGLIRRFFPKGTDFDNVSDIEIQYVQDWINNRPMKILNYLTPNEKLQELGVAFS